MQQKEVFLNSEADAWFERNRVTVANVDFATSDSVVAEISHICGLQLYEGADQKIRIVEIGCGGGARLSWLAENLNIEVFGVEPSAVAVDQARSLGVDATIGTAESLPFENGVFDILVFGFCLYLCDRDDLFRIAQEAHRVLKPEGWLIINDFHVPNPVRREYHHKAGIFSYKMDYRALFEWHPAYSCYSHKVFGHGTSEYTDNSQEWVSTSVLRKKAASDE